MTSRHVHLLRHAKSDWDTPGLIDHDRPLAPRGWTACAALARHLPIAGVAPDLVLCSSAVRAQQTLSGIRDGLPAEVTVIVDEHLYGAGPRTLLQSLQRVPEEAASVLLIAHNPGIATLAQMLVGSGDDDARQRLAARYPTAALASYSFEGAWDWLDEQGSRLDAFVTPRDLA